MTPWTKAIPDWFDSLELKQGAHLDRDKGMCVMEAVAYLAGREHSDHPPCVCPVIGTFLRNWNDNLPDDETRTRLLKPLVPLVIGTKSTPEVEERRSYMALDWFVREHVPAWFDLTPRLKPSGDALRALDEINTLAAAKKAGPVVTAAGDAAGDAARDAARAAARDAARAAARDAARAAAGDAAWDAAWDALQPTTERLQASAVELVKRMAAVADRTETEGG